MNTMRKLHSPDLLTSAELRKWEYSVILQNMLRNRYIQLHLLYYIVEDVFTDLICLIFPISFVSKCVTGLFEFVGFGFYPL